MNFIQDRVPDYIDRYYYFKRQVLDLVSGIASELIEFLYALITNRDTAGLTSVNNLIKSGTFFRSISYGAASRTFRTIGSEGIKLDSDTLAEIMIPLLLNQD